MAEASNYSDSEPHDDLEEQIRNIAERQSFKSGSNVEDDEKRWLIIGICLQKIISPALRRHLPPALQHLYHSLKRSHNIDAQTFSNYLSRYPPTNTVLNYEAINKNSVTPKIRRKCDFASFDFRVLNEVELSKLFLVTSMTNYTGFDDTCDLSALLGIVIHIDQFSPGLQSAAKAIRDDIRNPWAHCNFTEWDTTTFQNSFLLLEHLIKELHLPPSEENDSLKQLSHWKNTGFHLLQGTIGFECLHELKMEASLLAKYCRRMGIASKENIQIVFDSLNKQLEDVKMRVTHVEEQMNVICTKEFLSINREYFFLPDKNPNFVGREQELDELKQHLLSTEDQNIMVISGLGGVGKTTLALEYSWRNRDSYPGGMFWVLAEDKDSTVESVQNLMLLVGLPACEPHQAVSKFVMWLSQNPKRWLLVVDNLDGHRLEDNQLNLVSGIWKQCMKGHIIITTRREGINAMETFKANSYIHLHELTTPESICFLISRAECTSDKNCRATELLVEQLGRFPLALEQAALHIKFLRCSFSEYLEKFRTRRLKLRSLPKNNQLCKSDARLSITTTWLMNLELIEQLSAEEGLGSAATTVLEILALLPAPNVLNEVLNTGMPDMKYITVEDSPNANQNVAELREALCEEVSKKQVIEILARFSILDRDKTKEINMHQLTKEIVVENMADERKLLLMECAGRMVNKCLGTYEFTYHSTLTNDNVDLEVQKRKESLDKAYKVLKATRQRQKCVVPNHAPNSDSNSYRQSGPRFNLKSAILQALLELFVRGIASGRCTIL